MTLLISEDDALKQKLTGITVSDDKNASRPVGVWFGQPDLEVRAQAYPYLTIDLVDVLEDTSRSSQGIVPLAYVPDGFTADPDMLANGQYETEMPIPLILDYQITTYARHPRHDRGIISAFLGSKFPFRRGYIEVDADNTRRPVFMVQYTKRDMTEQGKRLFRNVFLLRVFSELFPSQIAGLEKVSTVNVHVNHTVNDTAPTSNDFTII